MPQFENSSQKVKGASEKGEVENREKKNLSWRGGCFLFAVALLVGGMAFTCAEFIIWEAGNVYFPIFWLLGFTILTFDLACSFLYALIYLVTTSTKLAECDLSSIPPSAIVYPIRNETTGLFQRMAYTFENNVLPGTVLWILSDSSAEFLAFEEELILKLRERFGEANVCYRHREKPFDAKPGNLKEWILNHGQDYSYFMVCDTDSVLPPGCLLKLLRKAEHPQNALVAIFQTKIEVIHAKTLFSRYQALGIRLAQQFYTDVKQRIFGSALSFGHGNLIRTDAFMKINVPVGVLSHDIWDMALLSRLGYRTVFCQDVISYEEVPSHYLEMRKRDRRWIKGNMKSAPLLFMSGMPLATRFYVFYGLYIYLVQPVFLFWMLMSLAGTSTVFGQFLLFKPIIGSSAWPFYIEIQDFTMALLAVVFGHKFVICRQVEDIFLVLKELAASVLLSLNNVVYQTADLFVLAFQPVRWIPMKKDPYRHATLMTTLKTLWPGTILGLAMYYFAYQFCLPYWTIRVLIMPFVGCLILSIPVVYVTSLPLYK